MSIDEVTPPAEAEQLTTLRANAIGLPGVLFQSVTTMAPAGAVAFSLGAAIPFTGGALPLAVVFAGPAIILALVLGIIIMLWTGLVYGPTLAFAFVGAVLTVPIILVYMATCLAVPFFYWREHRSEFSMWRHVILPAIPFILLGVVIYFQFVPLPAAPFILVGPIDAAWLVLGIIVIVFLSVRAPQVLHQGAKLFAEEPGVKESA
jgi:hypothetical protein